MLSRGVTDKASLKKLLSGQVGTDCDKMRLALIYYLCGENKNDLDELKGILKDSAYLPCLDYIRKLKSLHSFAERYLS